MKKIFLIIICILMIFLVGGRILKIQLQKNVKEKVCVDNERRCVTDNKYLLCKEGIWIKDLVDCGAKMICNRYAIIPSFNVCIADPRVDLESH